MSGWTMIVRAALASTLACFSVAASLNTPNADDDAAAETPVVASVTDQADVAAGPVVATVSDVAETPGATPVKEEAICEPVAVDAVSAIVKPSGRVAAHISDEPLDPTTETVARYRELQGSVLDTSPHLRAGEVAGEFAAALARIVREQASVERSSGDTTLELASQPISSTTDVASSDALRKAARELELRAAEAEDLHHFADADHLRDLATANRREARRWDEAGSPGSLHR